MSNQHSKHVQVSDTNRDNKIREDIESAIVKAHTEPQVQKEPDYIEGLEIDLKDLYSNKGQYTPDEKLAAVMAWVVTGSSVPASQICGIPAGTIRWWKHKALWWDDTVREVRKKKQDELDAKFTNAIDLMIDQIVDRVTHGDTKVTKDGDKIITPMLGKDLAWVLQILFDKRQLLRGDVTARVERSSEKEKLDRLAQQFEKMASQMNAKVIEAERVD